MCTYQITIDERTKEGKAIKKYILKAGAVKVSDKVSLDGLSYDYKKELDKSIKASKEDMIYFRSSKDISTEALKLRKHVSVKGK